MIKELAQEIRNDLFEKIDTMYNERKRREGLVSVHNTLLNNVKRLIDNWVLEQEEIEKEIRKVRCGK